MLSNLKFEKLWCSNIAIALGAGFVAALVSLPAHAVTCEVVRGLSAAEQDYWSNLLRLTSEERRHIRVACYTNYHAKRQEQDTPIAFQR
jgi:hypothetical protein